MGKMNLDILHNRKGTDCVKWDHKDFVDSRVSDSALPLWLSEMEFKVADEITDALIKRMAFLGILCLATVIFNLYKAGTKGVLIGR